MSERDENEAKGNLIYDDNIKPRKIYLVYCSIFAYEEAILCGKIVHTTLDPSSGGSGIRLNNASPMLETEKRYINIIIVSWRFVISF